ncbi:MAG TPA: PHP domain-containing protein [Ruminiclostridium sp.]|nr:PHP domain-containing protein [Ruminiclostridium sp.]
MKAAYDLHIHSALSPCADNDMTPNNIVNMCILKGLDVIAVTDHNTCANVRSLQYCAQKAGLLAIPAMELETAEEIHVVCLFPDTEAADCFQKLVYQRLPDMVNRAEIFGEQLLMNEKDEVVGRESRLLLNAASISINEAFDVVNKQLCGLAIPAHIDRESNSLLASFGVIPKDLDIRCVEISRRSREDSLTAKNGEIIRFGRIYSSDAHYLGNINERENFIEIDDLSTKGVIKALRIGCAAGS